jgi:hypothetical protein
MPGRVLINNLKKGMIGYGFLPAKKLCHEKGPVKYRPGRKLDF